MKSSRITSSTIFSVSALALALMAPSAFAAPINLSATLTGDIRLDNPDNLFAYVTIVGDTTSNQATWTFDINSPLHPDIKLDEFYFNMVGAASDYSFSGFNPTGWAINSTSVVVQGAGGVNFMFEALDPAGDQFNAANVTNSQNLSFTMTYAGGNLTSALFLDATTALSNDAGSGQLGAHLLSLTTDGNCGSPCSDSGFAFGNYNGPDDPDDPGEVPEPGVLFLLGAGLVGFGLSRRRKPV